MTESWLQGWLPRITSQNRKGIARALEPATLFDDQRRPAGAVVDAPSAIDDPGLLEPLRADHIPYFIDTSAWRFSDQRSWQSPKWSALPYTPETVLQPTREWVTRYVNADLAAQDRLDPQAFLLPSWFISDPDQAHDVAHWTVEAAVAARGRAVGLRPLIGQVSATRRSPEGVAASIDGLGDPVIAVFVQVDNSNPLHEAVDRLSSAVGLILAATAPDRPVVAMRAAAMASLLLGVGVTGVCSGPATGDRFSASQMVRSSIPRPRTEDGSASGGSGVRMYYAELGQAVGGKALAAVTDTRAAQAYLACRRSCHRFARPTPLSVATADYHSTLSRLEQCHALSEAPRGMRIDRAQRQLAAAATCVDGVNAALRDAQQVAQLGREHLDNMRSLLAGAAQGRTVA